MKEWRAIVAIVAFELRREWTGVAVTAFFAIYFGVFVTGALDVPDVHTGADRYLNGMRDWLYLFGFPLFGCLMNRTVFTYWRNDPFTRRIAHWRTMPIPIRAIVGARIAQAVLVMAIAGSLFIAMQAIAHSSFDKTAGAAEWIAAGLVWIGYGLTVQAAYLYLELGFPGKMFVIWYLGYTLLVGLISALAAWQDVSLIREVLRAVSKQPLLLPAAALLVAAVALGLAYRLTIRRMQIRRYIF
ncbi:hypothetical protein [Cohnella thermotolerans]|uniref:hypothetical protein n=1 Tax=Cohnella thermotolerans TaxID=329858 RepID=UPI0004067CDF|nr:hypothetical protein [Cohnella thermotolerans]